MTTAGSAVLTPAGAPEPRRAAGDARHDASRLAWQREMERAQSETWLGHAGVPASAPDARPHTHGAASPKPLSPMAALPPVRWVMAEAHTHGVESAPAGRPPHVPPVTPGWVQTAATATPATPALGVACAAAPSPAPRPMPRPVATPTQAASPMPTETAQPLWLSLPGVHEPVRVHVQWQGREAQVWVGADASHAQHMPHITELVCRWLAGQGVRVLSVVCNGQSITTHHSASQVDAFTLHLSRALPEAQPFIHITATREF